MNGDGLVDVIQTDKSTGHKLKVSYSTGNGISSSVYQVNEISPGLTQWDIFTKDMNGDGLADIVQKYDGIHGNIVKVKYNRGSGFSNPITLINEPTASQWDILLEDMNGDGLVDVIQTDKSTGHKLKVSYNKNKINNKIKKITDSFGNQIDIEYKRLSDETIYTKYNDTSSPNRDIKGVKQVVSSVSSKTLDKDIDSITTYTYEGLKVNLRGLGSLGFAKITSFNNLNNIKIETTYNQTYPFVGMEDNTTTYMGDKELSSTQNIYKKQIQADYPEIISINLYETIEKNYNYNDEGIKTHLSTITTTNEEIDKYGNVELTVSKTVDNTTGEVFKKTITNTYLPEDKDNWILGRLQRARVTHEAPNVDPKTKTSSFTYDKTTGILLSETIEPDSIDKWFKKEYTYYDNGNRRTETTSGAGIQSNTTTYTYDPQDKYIQSISNTIDEIKHKISKTYDDEGNVKTITDINGLTTSYEYDNFGKKIKEIKADGTYTEYKYSFDSLDNIDNVYYKIETKTLGFSDTTVYYNSLGKVVATKKAGFKGDIYTTIEYDKFGNVVKQSLPYYEGESKQYITTKFDKYNRVEETNNLGTIDKFRYEDFTTTHENHNKQEKETTKNVLGKVTKVVDAKGSLDESIVTYKYDALSNLTDTYNSEDESGIHIELKYDEYGYKKTQIDPDMGTWHYTYYASGQLKTQTDAKGQTTHISYDKLGRKISETLSDGSLSTWKYDTAQNGIGLIHIEIKKDSNEKIVFKKEYAYDQYSRLSSITTTIEDKTFTKSYTYDQYGRLKDKTLSNDFKVINTYDNNGYLISIKSPKEQIEDFDGTHFVNLVVELLTSSESLYDEYLEYQEKSNSLKQTAKEYKDLAQENPNESTSLLNVAQQLEANALEYELQAKESQQQSNENLIKANNYLAQANNYYSTGNNSIGDFYEDLYNQYKAYSDNKKELSQKYLELSKENTPNTQFYLDISQFSLLESIETSTIADNLKLRSEQHNSNGEITQGYILDNSEFNYFYMALEYNSKDQAIKNLVGNGLVNTLKLNDDGTISNITTGYNGLNQIRDLEFLYDNLNNLDTRLDHKLDTLQRYKYDNLNRIKNYENSTAWTNYTTSYRYDKSGNIKYKSDVSKDEDYEYYTGTHRVKQAGSKSYTYDLNGNMLTNGSTEFTYNSFNKNKTISTKDHNISFYYDTNKQRYKKTQIKLGSTDTTTTYYMDKSYEYISSSNGNKERYFIYVDGKVISIYTKDLSNTTLSNTKYLHYDSLNSIDTITNNIGEVKARMSYTPFGKKIEPDEEGKEKENPSYTNRGYTGHEHIENTDYIHMNARIYDPDIGRFMSADTMIPYMYNSQSFNRYSYVRNNPLKYIDPTGHWGWSPRKIIKKATRTVKKVVKAHVNVVKKVKAEAKRFETKHRAELKAAAVIAVSAAVGNYAMTLNYGAIVAGAMAGTAGGIVGTKINGGSWSDAFDAGLKGAVIGAISAGVADGVANGTGDLFGIGADAGHKASFFSGHTGAAAFKAVAHGISRAAIAKAQGNNTSSAFWAGFVASGFAAPGDMDPLSGTMATAVLSGTTSVITGGKFSNGAMTGAFVHMFNSLGSKAAKSAGGQATSNALNTDEALERIIRSGVEESISGAMTGAAVGAVADDIGAVVGAYIGARVGFAYGIAKQAILEAFPAYHSYREVKEIAIGTTQGYIEHQIGK